MPGGTVAAAGEARATTLQRGPAPIPVKRLDDRFTVLRSGSTGLDHILAAPGVEAIGRIRHRVAEVRVSPPNLETAMAALRADPATPVVHHAYSPAAAAGTTYMLTDRIVVSFEPGTPRHAIEAIFARYRLAPLASHARSLPGVYVVQVTAESGENPIKIANRLTAEPAVEIAEPSLVNSFHPASIPTDTQFPRQWHLSAADGPQLRHTAAVGATEAWDITMGDRSVVVAVIDDGFDLTHPDFVGPGKVVQPRDYVDGDNRPWPVKEHNDSHGTPCAGVAVAEANGIGTVGVAPGCAFMPIRFPFGADDTLLIEAFLDAARFADVISCSWAPRPSYRPLSTVLSRALTLISESGGPRGNGTIVCFAAGNYAAPVEDPENPGGVAWSDGGNMRMATGPICNGFAAHPDVVTVAASTSEDRHAAYSNWGGAVTVCAPSSNFHPFDHHALPGRAVVTVDNEPFGMGFTPGSRYTDRFGGTSAATPIVAGVAALVRSANPALTGREVREILASTADKVVDESPDPVYSRVRGVYSPDGRCDWFGHGKVNAARAVAEAARRRGSVSLH